MQNPILDIGYNSTIYEKSGYLFEKLETVISSNYYRV